MTRGIIGIVLLLVLLAGGMFTQWTMDKIQSPITQELTQAAQAGERRLWNAATLHQQTAARAWRKGWRVTAALADHMPMEDIDSLFARPTPRRKRPPNMPPPAGSWPAAWKPWQMPTD